MSFGRIVIALTAAQLCLLAQPAHTDPQALFNLVRTRATAMVNNAPRYTCVETIERTVLRSGFQTRGGCEASSFSMLAGTYKPIESDRLRLDVGVSGNQEIFSWHGQHQFVTSDITELVQQGAVSSGSFFAFIADVLITGKGHYTYRGLSMIDGESLAVFNYSIPQDVSHFIAKVGNHKHAVGFHGQFTADPETGRLHSISVDTDELAGDQACEMNQSVNYQELLVGGQPFRIPAFVTLIARMRNHDEIQSTSHYSECHEFVGQSTIHFDNKVSPTVDAFRPTASLPELPPKQRLKLRLTSPIDSSTAWTGDAVTASLENTLRGKRGKTIAAKGTTVSGRIVGLRQFLGDKPWWSLDLRFDRLDTSNGGLRMSLESRSPVTAGVADRLFHHGSPFPETEELIKPGPSEFHIPGSHFRLDQSFVTEWESR